MALVINLCRISRGYSVPSGAAYSMAAAVRNCENQGPDRRIEMDTQGARQSQRKLGTEGSGCDMLIAPLQPGAAESWHLVRSKTAWE